MRLKPSMAEHPAPGFAFVARRGGVVEVVAPRPLHGVAAVGGHVAELGGRAGQDRPREKGIAALHLWVVRGIRVRHERAESQPAVGQFARSAPAAAA